GALAVEVRDEIGERDDVIVIPLEVVELLAELLDRRGVAELLRRRVARRGAARNRGVRRRGVDLVIAKDRRHRRAVRGGERKCEKRRENQGAEAGHPRVEIATEVPRFSASRPRLPRERRPAP